MSHPAGNTVHNTGVPPPARPVGADSPQASAAALRGLNTMRIVMAGGGTGGHLYPGLAVAEVLREMLPQGLELVWAATPRPIDQRLLAGFGENYVPQAVRGLSKKPWRWWGFVRAWRKSCGYWRAYFQSHPVNGVLALGGYAAAPAALVASQRGIPVAVLNPDALPGRANHFLIRRANIVFTQWDWPLGVVRPGGPKTMVTGCPIRRSLVGLPRNVAAERLKLDPSKRTLVITGASLGAKTINDAIAVLLQDPTVVAALGETRTREGAAPTHGNTRWQILHLTGLGQAEAARGAAARFSPGFWTVLEYADDMAAVWSVADLAIARSGAGLCAELTACGVPAILLPYPYHRDRHQEANARQLTGAGAAVMIRDRKDATMNAADLRPVLLDLLTDDNQRRAMADAAHKLGRPEAAAQVAHCLIALMAGKANSR